jgi:NAD(P)H dehydrogenase (quinone)
LHHKSLKERIAIAGATGRVGSALTSLLASDPVDIVVLTRRPDAAQPANGVTIAAIDFYQPYTLQEALRGADRLFVSHGSSPRQVANEIALIDSIARLCGCSCEKSAGSCRRPSC